MRLPILERADLSKACLQNANLAGAQLSGANLQEADFKGADLTLAVINEADFTNARNLTQEQIDACVFIKDNDVSNKNPPILPEGMKPSFAVMTDEEWRSLEDQREMLGGSKGVIMLKNLTAEKGGLFYKIVLLH